MTFDTDVARLQRHLSKLPPIAPGARTAPSPPPGASATPNNSQHPKYNQPPPGPPPLQPHRPKNPVRAASNQKFEATTVRLNPVSETASDEIRIEVGASRVSSCGLPWTCWQPSRCRTLTQTSRPFLPVTLSLPLPRPLSLQVQSPGSSAPQPWHPGMGGAKGRTQARVRHHPGASRLALRLSGGMSGGREDSNLSLAMPPESPGGDVSEDTDSEEDAEEEGDADPGLVAEEGRGGAALGSFRPTRRLPQTPWGLRILCPYMVITAL